MKTGFNLIYIILFTIFGYSKNLPVEYKIKINPYLKYKESFKKISVNNLIKVVSTSNDNINYRAIMFSEH
jgi:hypothetical protein